MPKLAGYQDVQFIGVKEWQDGDRQTPTHSRQVPMQQTRQGVRNLDTGRNGRRSNSCMHVRDPQGTPTVTKTLLALDPDTGAPLRKHHVHCALCDDVLGPADAD